MDMMNAMMGPSGDDTDYPSLHIDNHPDVKLLNMPDEGEAKIRYRIKHREQREHTDEKGKKKRKVSLT